MSNEHDIIVVGAGSAGLTAAMFAARRGMSVLCVSPDMGGQTAAASKVNNYPGVSSLGGRELMEKFLAQAQEAGAQFLWQSATKVEKKDQAFVVSAGGEGYPARSVVLAFGLAPRTLGVTGEDKFLGKQIVNEVIGHEELFRGQDVAVVGAGSSAFLGAGRIAALARKVYLVHRSEQFRSEPALVKELQGLDNVEFVLNAKTKEFQGGDSLEKIVLEQEGQEKSLAVGAAYLAIGFQPNAGWVGEEVLRDEKGEIVADKDAATSVEGLFAAGDATNVGWKQVVVSAGEGCKAALGAVAYVAAQKGEKFNIADWS